MAAIRTSVLTGCGRRKRLRTTGPFLRERRLTCISYLGLRAEPTSKARIYLVPSVSIPVLLFLGSCLPYLIASQSENCSIGFRSCVIYVLCCFFFLGADPSFLLYFAAFAEFDPIALL
jgi:hypothetical protein